MAVRNTLLGLLAARPRHGYELHAAFEALVGGKANWDLKVAQIYTTLDRLERAGQIRRQGVVKAAGPERQVYAITPEGRKELQAWMHRPVEGGHQRDEFFLKLMVCLSAGLQDPYQLIYSQRAALYRELHALAVRRSESDVRKELGVFFLMDRATMHLEADLQWLEKVESRLDEIRGQSIPEPAVRRRGRPVRAQQPPSGE